MGGSNPDPADRGTDPEDAFALVGNETRAAILRALGKTPHESVSFSALRQRVDGSIDSGQFNYHLSELVGTFVDGTDDGYRLRPEGRLLYRAIRSGRYSRRARVDPFDAGFTCHFCGAPVEASYEDGTFDVACTGCGHLYSHTSLPPSAVEADDGGDLLSRVDRYVRHDLLAYVERVCPYCAHPLEATFRRGEDVYSEGAENLDAFVRYDCDYCGNRQYVSVGITLLFHPDVVAFFRDHGTDVTSVPHWELEWAMTDRCLTVRSTDPWEVALELTRDGETLEAVVREDLSVEVARS